MEQNGFIHEIFHSIQGEGIECGLPYIFVRFCECNISCQYCDSPKSKIRSEKVIVAPYGQSLPEQSIPNPVTVPALCELIRSYPYRNITFTGGEPLIQSVFIDSLLPHLDGLKILMETNGTLYQNITSNMIKRVDRWAVDIKLPSLAGYDLFDIHEQFLNELTRARSVTIKVIFSSRTSDEELFHAAEIAHRFHRQNSRSCLIFQPLTDNNLIEIGNNLSTVYEIMAKTDMEIRLIPQIHKILNIP